MSVSSAAVVVAPAAYPPERRAELLVPGRGRGSCVGDSAKVDSQRWRQPVCVGRLTLGRFSVLILRFLSKPLIRWECDRSLSYQKSLHSIRSPSLWAADPTRETNS